MAATENMTSVGRITVRPPDDPLWNIGVVPDPALQVIEAIEAAGFEAWLVGGFVRDALRGVNAHDVDITTNAHWEEVARACESFASVFETGVKHGTVTVVVDSHPIEVTTYRVEGEYGDGRHPDSVQFVNSVEEDLARRDFTMNAMAYHPDRGLVDPFGGKEDLRRGIVRCVGDAKKRFSEDALRILRAIRFVSQLSFRLDPETEAAAFECAPLLANVAGERVATELERLLCGDNIHDVLMDYVDILGVVEPALLPMKGLDQRSRWHAYDVLEHTAYVVANTPPYPKVRWAALYHDTGKPDTFVVDSNGVGHMPGHQKASVVHLAAAARRFHFSHSTAHDLHLLVLHHDFHPEPTRKSVRKLYVKLEAREDLFHTICDLMRGDALGQAEFCHDRTHKIDEVEQVFREMIIEEHCFKVTDLPITGIDLIELGVPQGPEVGRMLNELFARVVEEDIPCDRESLLYQAAMSLEECS